HHSSREHLTRRTAPKRGHWTSRRSPQQRALSRQNSSGTRIRRHLFPGETRQETATQPAGHNPPRLPRSSANHSVDEGRDVKRRGGPPARPGRLRPHLSRPAWGITYHDRAAAESCSGSPQIPKSNLRSKSPQLRGLEKYQPKYPKPHDRSDH